MLKSRFYLAPLTLAPTNETRSVTVSISRRAGGDWVTPDSRRMTLPLASVFSPPTHSTLLLLRTFPGSLSSLHVYCEIRTSLPCFTSVCVDVQQAYWTCVVLVVWVTTQTVLNIAIVRSYLCLRVIDGTCNENNTSNQHHK